MPAGPLQMQAGQLPGPVPMMQMQQMQMPNGQGPAPGVQMMPVLMPMQAMGGAPQGATQQLAPQQLAPPPVQAGGPNAMSAPPSAPPQGLPFGTSPTSPTSPPPAGNADDDEPPEPEVTRNPDAVHAWNAGRQLFTEAIDSRTVDELAHDGQAMASKGSSLHGTGRCAPCAWYWKVKGCQNGAQCDYCHLCPEGELKNRKKQKVAQIRQTAAETTSSQPSQPKGAEGAAAAQAAPLMAPTRSLALSSLL